MTKRLLLPLSILLTMFALAPAAQAAISVTKTGAVLTATSDNGGSVDESYTVREVGPNVIVITSPAPTGDPDGIESNCTTTGNEAICNRAAISSVRIVAGNGVDTIDDGQAQGSSTIEGGSGNDQITTQVGAEAEVLGQAGGDTITSAGAADTLDGGEDADTLTAIGDKAFDGLDSGGPGNDTFVGNPELTDVLNAEDGADTYGLGTHAPTGSAGDPAFLQMETAPDLIGYDGIAVPVAVSLDGIANDGRGGEGDNVGADVEIVVGGDAGDQLQAGTGAAQLYGGGGGDQLLGGPAPDQLRAGEGDDVIRGGGGDDELQDGDFTPGVTSSPLPPAGNDVLDGGDGEDFLNTDRGADDISGGPGFDFAQFGRPIPQAPSVPTPPLPAAFTVSLDDVANDGQTGSGEGDNVHSDVEGIESGGGADAINGSGAANDIVTGAGNDVVDPGAGPDVVNLGRGDDRVTAVDQTTDFIRCEAGFDTAVADLPGGQAERADALFACENVSGTPFPPVDAKGPVLKLSGKAIKSKKFLKTGQLNVIVACDEACSLSGEAFTTLAHISRAGEYSLGTGKLKLGTGKRTLRVTVAKKYRNQFRRKLRTKGQKRRGLKFRVALVAKDAAGNVTNASRVVKVKG